MGERESACTLWTIGHGSAETDRLFELLKHHRIELLVDVRSTPYSKYVPQANRDVLAAAAEARGVSYLLAGGSLGGKPADERFLNADGKPDYARIAEADFFVDGIDHLVDQAKAQRVCILCSEEDPARCHRGNLISPVLVSRGFTVLHIRHDGTAEPHDQMELRKTGGQLTLF